MCGKWEAIMNAQTLIAHKNVELIEIGHQMNQKGLSEEFVAAAV